MSRLEKNTEKRNESKLNWNDMDEARWRRAQGIDEDTKVFIITGFYPSLREALLERDGLKIRIDIVVFSI